RQSLLADWLAAVAAQAALINHVFSFAIRQCAGHLWWNDRVVREILGQIIDKPILGLRRYLSAPAYHLVYLGHPFVPRQPLLKHRLGAMTAKASFACDIQAIARWKLVLLSPARPDVGYQGHTGDQGAAKPGNVDTANSSLRLLCALCASAVSGPIPRGVSSFNHFQLAIPWLSSLVPCLPRSTDSPKDSMPPPSAGPGPCYPWPAT